MEVHGVRHRHGSGLSFHIIIIGYLLHERGSLFGRFRDGNLFAGAVLHGKGDAITLFYVQYRSRYGAAEGPGAVANAVGHFNFLGKDVNAHLMMLVALVVERLQVGQLGYIFTNHRWPVIILSEDFRFRHSKCFTVQGVFTGLGLSKVKNSCEEKSNDK